MKQPKITSTTGYLKRVPARQKAMIRRTFEAELRRKGHWTGQHPMSQLNDEKRSVLERVIFEVVNAFESTGKGRPRHPTTIALHDARNLLFDDLGWNEDVFDKPAKVSRRAA